MFLKSRDTIFIPQPMLYRYSSDLLRLLFPSYLDGAPKRHALQNFIISIKLRNFIRYRNCDQSKHCKFSKQQNASEFKKV